MRRALSATRTALLALLPLLAIGCVDFAGPEVLELERPTRMEIRLSLGLGRAACAPPAPARVAHLCVSAELEPGVDVRGARLPVTDDTLRVLGEAIAPAETRGQVRFYRRVLEIPRERLAEAPITVAFPKVRGSPMPALSWRAVEPASPDTMAVTPGSTWELAIELPTPALLPHETAEQWALYLSGDSAALSFVGAGLPPPRRRLPATVLADLGGDTLRASLHYVQAYTPRPTRAVLLHARLEEILPFTILLSAANAPGRSAVVESGGRGEKPRRAPGPLGTGAEEPLGRKPEP